MSTWEAILTDAVRAPSAHNTQPWKVVLRSEHEAELWYEPARLLPVEDPDSRFLVCSIGLFVEALDVAGRARGFRVDCDWQPHVLDASAGAPQRLGSLTLHTDEEPPRFPAALLHERRTSRLPYSGRPAAPAALDVLAALAAEHGYEASFSSEQELVDFVLWLNVDTLFYDLAEDDRRSEIEGWLRYSEREAQARRDGFSPRCLLFPGPLLRLFFRHHSVVASPVVEGALKRLYRRSLRGSATVGWIRGPWRTPADWFGAGRMLMRLWLELTRHGLVVHPFGSVITNPTAHARLLERLDLADGGEDVWLLLRIGYSKRPPESARRAIVEDAR